MELYYTPACLIRQKKPKLQLIFLQTLKGSVGLESEIGVTLRLLKLYRMTDIFLLSLITNPLQRLFWSPSIASRGLKISASE